MPSTRHLSAGEWSMACGIQSGDVARDWEDVTCPLCRLAILKECESILDHAVTVLQDWANQGHRRGLGGSTMHIEAEWDAALANYVPVRIACDDCGESRALSTPIAVLVAHDQSGVSNEDNESIWIRQCEDFREHHRCDEVDRG